MGSATPPHLGVPLSRWLQTFWHPCLNPYQHASTASRTRRMAESVVKESGGRRLRAPRNQLLGGIRHLPVEFLMLLHNIQEAGREIAATGPRFSPRLFFR